MKSIFSHKTGVSYQAKIWVFVILNTLVNPVFAQSHSKNPYKLPITYHKKEVKAQADSNGLLQIVNLENFIPGLKKDIRYATPYNFTGTILYPIEGLFMRKDAAEKLLLITDSLQKMGLGILVFDAYRPYAATLKMWKIVPDDRYAANPANGSGHNRGSAIDLTLINLKTSEALTMPTGYDDFSDSAHHTFMNLDSSVLANRALLKGVMEHFGFNALETDWWHYALPHSKNYPLMDISFK